MALNKQPVNINFAKGLNTKTDPKQVQLGSFLELQNSIFDTEGLLKKRNGFGELTPVNIDNLTTLGTFNGGLLAVGDSIQAYSSETKKWVNRGNIQNISLDVLAAVRTNTGQVTADLALHTNGLACVAWQDTAGAAYYQVIDSSNGNIIVAATLLAAVGRSPRCYILGNYFVVIFLATVSAAPHLQYVAIPLNNLSSPSSATDISTTISSISAGYDGVIANNNLYIAIDGSDGGGAVRIYRMDSTLTQYTPVILAGKTASLASVTADTSGSSPLIWVTAWASGSGDAYTWVYASNLVQVLGATKTISAITIAELSTIATAGVMTLLYETNQNYSYVAVRSDMVSKKTVTQAGVVGSASVVLRGLGLASRAFYSPTTSAITFLGVYGGAFQPTYFMADVSGKVLAKLAYSNGVTYGTSQVLSNVTIQDNTINLAYLFTDLIQPVNKAQGLASAAGVYAQKGINLAMFTLDEEPASTSEIGGSLHLSGGFLWQYDGVKPVEHSFHLWPEDTKVTTATTGGSISDQLYYYVATYEWTDAAGNIHRSAPSVPYAITTAGGDTSTNTIKVPTYRLTYKTGVNKVRIVLYRWSVSHQTYYQVTSITSPTANDTTVDSVTITDTLVDADIVGNTILYTTGGVVENIAAPACSSVTLFKSRLLLVPAEDPNNVWYSKQVLSATPVEMSDLFTLYIAPSLGAQGSTGSTKVLSGMDDKAIFFKKQAIYYAVGTGPDNTGANNDFSEPVFITTTVGCENQRSVVFMPQGLMFQAADGKGIWLLGRDLSTKYIGAEVEAFNDATVLSAINIPGTNQVRFTLDTGVTLTYDYYYGQWGTFINIPAQSSVIFEGLHTYLNSFGLVFQETPDLYLDGSSPVLMKFTTSWFNIAGLQGYERAYFFYLLGTYLSPHKLQVDIAYDYNDGPSQSTTITPDNSNNAYGDDELYGSGSPYGGSGNVEQERVFFKRQRCEAFKLTCTEIFDNTSGQAAGAGFTMSGINAVIGIKKGYYPLKPSRSAG